MIPKQVNYDWSKYYPDGCTYASKIDGCGIVHEKSPTAMHMTKNASSHEKEWAVFVWQECTIWETAWYLRSMENLMMDMAMEDEKSKVLAR